MPTTLTPEEAPKANPAGYGPPICPDCGKTLDTRRQPEEPRIWLCKQGCMALFHKYENGTWVRIP